MQLSRRVLLPCLLLSACASRTGNTETVCTAHFGRSCTHYEVRETAEGKFFRESRDRLNQEQAAKTGTAFFPEHMPGESSFHYLSRVQDANSSSNSKWGGGSSIGGSCCGGASSFGSASNGSSGGSSFGTGSSFGGGR
jgi:hypothetical protein